MPQVRSVLRDLDAGSFRRPALLVERMLENPRFRGVVETRLNGLISSHVKWRPARNNRDARKAAAEFEEDWRYIAPGPVRKQLAESNLLLGVQFAQRVLVQGPSGRFLPVVRPYWPGFAEWQDIERQYRLEQNGGKFAYVQSPALGGEVDPARSAWIVGEQFGAYSWRRALVRAAWRPWLGHEWAQRDQNRASEKHGIGIIKAKYPRGTGDEHRAAIDKYVSRLRTMPSEGVIPLEQRGDGEANFDVEPFEFNGSGFAAIDSAMNAAAVALAILLLGHNLTTEIKGGSFAAASVGDYIRDDVKTADAAAEAAWLSPQVSRVWALWNYDDPSLAPEPEYVTDSPAVNQAWAQMTASLAQAMGMLREHVPAVDLEALAEMARLPLRPESETVQVPAEAAQVPAASDTMPTIDLTPTDIATVVTVDETRESIGLAAKGGDVGSRWVAEHSAAIKADVAPQLAVVANAEQGNAEEQPSP